MKNLSQTYKPKLVITLSRFPFPIEKGDKLRAYYQIRELSKYWDIYLICLSDRNITESEREEVEVFTKELHVFKLSKLGILINVFLQFFSSKPFQVGYFYNALIHRKIKRLLSRIEPDHILCQLIRTSEYVKNYHNCPKTLDYMDTLSAGIKRRVEQQPFYKKWLFRAEWKRLSQYENILFDYFEYHTIISEQDRELISHPQKSKIGIIPNGVGEHFFTYETKPTLDREYDIVFIGNLSYPPNISAVEYIVHHIIPEAINRGMELKVLISGANPSIEVKRMSQHFKLTGWVDDIRESYSKGKLFIAPMFIGTGLQNKLLEAMALGIPCITTPLANNALGASNKEITLAENASQFVDNIQELLKNTELYAAFSLNGSSYVKNNFDWETVTKQLSDKMMTYTR